MNDWWKKISEMLLPMLAKCWESTSTEDPQDYLRDNYDPGTGQFEPSVVRAAIPATRRAIHKTWQKLDRRERKTFPRYSRSDMYEIAEMSLKEALDASSEAVLSILKVAATLPDGDD